MKLPLLLALGLAVAGCRQEAPHPEILTRLKALETELAKRPAPVRWATADREKLSHALYAQGRKQLEEFMQTEKVSPEQRAQIAAYEALNQQLLIKPRPPSVPTPLPRAAPILPPLPPRELSARLPASVPPPTLPPAPTPPPTPPAPTVAEQEYAALAKRVSEAKAPVAALIERRAQITGKYYGREFMEQLIAEYAKDRFDLVVNSDRMSLYDRPLLYRTSAAAPDITEVLLQFFRDREKK
jgi:hypothetical protein